MAAGPQHAADDQRRLVAALRDPATFGAGVRSVGVIETHISVVLLTGQLAYKIKKPVALPFLDFSTLEARRRYCDLELTLNRRLAPEIYLDVIAITGTPERPAIGGDGPVIEYAVKMREFPQESLACNVLARGGLTVSHVDDLAELVAAFHGRVGIARADGPYGAPAEILRAALDNLSQILPLPGDPAERESLDALRVWTIDEFARHASAFEGRRRDGFVRECHGDLHLGNIAIVDGRPAIFDCIEFNDHLRWIDVMSEIAFAVMDLADRKRPDLAWHFLNRWLEITGDYEGAALLRFYAVYRAMVRAKVTRLRAAQFPAGAAQASTLADYRSYVHLAREFARRPRPALVITHGLSGCGKSAVTQLLLESVGAIRVRTDVERKRLRGLGAAERSGSSIASALYTEEATRATYDRALALAQGIAHDGHLAIVDGTFLRRWQRDCARQAAADAGAPFAIVDFVASEATLRKRIVRRDRDGIDASEADLAVLAHQMRTQEPLADDERDVAVAFDAEAPLDGMRRAGTWDSLLVRLGFDPSDPGRVAI
jgi:aminoglycoside phosphotransferase family enzyme/predicted kinase